MDIKYYHDAFVEGNLYRDMLEIQDSKDQAFDDLLDLVRKQSQGFDALKTHRLLKARFGPVNLSGLSDESYARVREDVVSAVDEIRGESRGVIDELGPILFAVKLELLWPLGMDSQPSRQGGSGNCALMAAIRALQNKSWGQEIIADCIKFTGEKNEFMVHFAGDPDLGEWHFHVKKQHLNKMWSMGKGAEAAIGTRIFEYGYAERMEQVRFIHRATDQEVIREKMAFEGMNMSRVLKSIGGPSLRVNRPRIDKAGDVPGWNSETCIMLAARDREPGNTGILNKHAYVIESALSHWDYINPHNTSNSHTILKRNLPKLFDRISVARYVSIDELIRRG